MTTPRKIELGPLAGHTGVTVAALHSPGAHSGTYAVQIAPGACVPSHAHPNAETIIAYESLAVTVGDAEYWVPKGHAIDIPPGVEHRIENPRVRPVDYISIATPPWEGTPAMLVPASVIEAMAGTEDDAEECLFVARCSTESAGSETFESRLEDAVSVAANGLKAVALLTRDMPGQGRSTR